MSQAGTRYALKGALVLMSLLGGCTGSDAAEGGERNTRPAPSSEPPVLAVRSASETQPVSQTRSAEAFTAIFGTEAGPIWVSRDVGYLYAPGEMVQSDGASFFLAPGAAVAPSPVTTGVLGVYRLEETRQGRLVVSEAWPEAVSGSIMGEPPRWRLSRDFGQRAVLLAAAGGVWQGILCERTQIVELSREGPRPLGGFVSAYDDSGSGGDQRLDGEITNIVPGRSFDIAYSGSRTFTHRYERRGDRYAPTSGASSQETFEC